MVPPGVLTIFRVFKQFFQTLLVNQILSFSMGIQTGIQTVTTIIFYIFVALKLVNNSKMHTMCTV